MLGTGRVDPHLLNTVVLAVADGLFGLSGSELWDALLTGVPSVCVRSSPAVLYGDTAVVFRGEPQKPDNSARATINAS